MGRGSFGEYVQLVLRMKLDGNEKNILVRHPEGKKQLGRT
jgi:hypothetical protein